MLFIFQNTHNSELFDNENEGEDDLNAGGSGNNDDTVNKFIVIFLLENERFQNLVIIIFNLS